MKRFQILKKRKQLGWIPFLCFVTLPLEAFSFPVLHTLPQNAVPAVKSDEPVSTPYVEKRSLAEIWDTARDHEESFTFFKQMPARASEKHPQDVVLIVFPKITSGLFRLGNTGSSKLLFGKAGHRYPPLISYEGETLTLFQLLQAGHRACEITMTVQHGEIVSAKESVGCVDYESKGNLLSKDLIGAKILPPQKRPGEA